MRESGQDTSMAAPFDGGCVLVVEDDYFIADDLSVGLKRRGIGVLGPVPSLTAAIALMESTRIDGALLDINLNGEMVYAVADGLMARRIPVVFVTGYDAAAVPERYAAIPLCQKPFDVEAIVAALARAALG